MAELGGKRKNKLIEKLLVFICWMTILYVIYIFFKDTTLEAFSKSIDEIYSYNGWWWLLGLIAFSMYLRGKRWVAIFCSSINENNTVSLQYHGWFFVLSMLSIFRVGEVLRINWLRQRGMVAAKALSYIFVEKLSDAFVLALVLSLCIFMAVTSLATISLVISFAIIFVYLSLTFCGSFIERKLNALNPQINNRHLSFAFDFFKTNLKNSLILNNTSINLTLMAFSIAIWTVVILAFHLFITHQFAGVPWYASALIVAMVNLTGVLNLSPANIGPFELSVAVVLVLYEVSQTDAAIFAVTLNFYQY